MPVLALPFGSNQIFRYEISIGPWLRPNNGSFVKGCLPVVLTKCRKSWLVKHTERSKWEKKTEKIT